MIKPDDPGTRRGPDLTTANFRTDAGLTVDDVRRDLDMGEWELALGMLEDVSDEHPQPTRFWQLLADAAILLQLDRSVVWCHWRATNRSTV